jgi:hypothetical protein|tara:strand:+ start:450 stop:587 length:138 start_codon:yes stop_codon:yes gene_type:complete
VLIGTEIQKAVMAKKTVVPGKLAEAALAVPKDRLIYSYSCSAASP